MYIIIKSNFNWKKKWLKGLDNRKCDIKIQNWFWEVKEMKSTTDFRTEKEGRNKGKGNILFVKF